jgi:hypothetical protein
VFTARYDLNLLIFTLFLILQGLSNCMRADSPRMVLMLKVEVSLSVKAVSQGRSVSVFRAEVLDCLTAKREGTRILRNGSNYLPSGTVSHPRRLQSGVDVS